MTSPSPDTAGSTASLASEFRRARGNGRRRRIAIGLGFCAALAVFAVMEQAAPGNAEVRRSHVTAYAPPPPNPFATLISGIFDPAARTQFRTRAATPDRVIPTQHPRPGPPPQLAGAAPSSSQPTRLVCVRLCDGYFFPAPNHSGPTRGDRACADACPGAPTRLYSMRGDSIMDAVAVGTGLRYSHLPVSLQYTRRIESTCSCGAIDPQDVIAQDSTLRRGDRYMTANGFVIYQGPPSGPRGPRDFTPLAQARGIPASERRMLVRMENASRTTSAGAAAQAGAPQRMARWPAASVASR
jgi:hypothetical protein